MRTVAVDSFVPMLASLSEILDKGAAFAKDRDIDLANCRLAPDMYTLAQQVQQACHHARNGMSRLAGQPAAGMGEVEATLSGLKDQIAKAINFIRSVPDAEFDGAERRDCSIEIANGLVIKMDGLRFVESWALPHFYFHVVTAYGILRHAGVDIGKRDYLSQVGDFIQPKAA
jgi:hypothetical protein